MPDAAESGASIAWHLLATLEGGSLLLATSALLAYTASIRLARQPQRQPVKSVLLTNTTSELGRALKRRLELQGCSVSTVTSEASSEAGSGSNVDALVVVGAKPKASDLNGISDLVTEDVYNNLKLLESLSSRVHRGGCIAWACAGPEAVAGLAAGSAAFTGTAAAFDTVLQANLQHIAKVSSCEPVWVGRCDGAERTAERIAAALTSPRSLRNTYGFSIRNAVLKVGEYLYRCLKTTT